MKRLVLVGLVLALAGCGGPFSRQEDLRPAASRAQLSAGRSSVPGPTPAAHGVTVSPVPPAPASVAIGAPVRPLTEPRTSAKRFRVPAPRAVPPVPSPRVSADGAHASVPAQRPASAPTVAAPSPGPAPASTAAPSAAPSLPPIQCPTSPYMSDDPAIVAACFPWLK